MPHSRPHIAPLNALFFATGIATVLQGILLPAVSHDTQSADLRLATALAVQFTGQLLGPLIPWRRPAFGLACGCLLTTFSALALAFVSARLYLPILLVYGLALGITMTMANVLVGLESEREERTSRLELLNIFWPLGAACCSPFVLHIPPGHRVLVSYAFLAVSFAVAAAWMFVRRGPVVSSYQVVQEDESVSLLRLVTLCALALLAVGIESGLANWLPTLNTRYHARGEMLLPLAAVFWGGVLASRTLAAYFLRHTSDARWLTPLCVMVYALAVWVVMTSSNAMLLYPATLLAAMAVGPVYPAQLAEAVSIRGKGLVFFAAGIGSALCPWLVGRVSAYTHSLRIGMVPLIVGALLMFAGVLFEQRLAIVPASRRQL